MNNKNRLNGFIGKFALSGVTGIVGIIAIAIVSFTLGGLYFSGSPDNGTQSAKNTAEEPSKPTVWTCAMHPQIQLSKPGKCPLCFMDLIPLETDSGDEIDPSQLRLSETAMQLARIQTTPVIRAFADHDIQLFGKVTYDETRLSYITSWVPGRLDRLYADYTGMTVNKGDHMVYMYSPELVAAQEELLQANSAIAALSRTSSSVLKSTAVATVEAAREKLRLAGLSVVQIEEIESSGEVSDHLTIYAPIGGVVIHKNAQEGMYVKTGTRIYTIADLTKLWIIFEAYESDLPWVRYGQKVEFTSSSFPGETFSALISFVDPVVNSMSRTVRVRAVIDNPKLRLKPDMFVRGVIRSRIDNNGNVIDEDLIGKWISPMHPEIIKDAPGQCDICGMDMVSASSLGYSDKAPLETDAPLLIPVTSPLITGKRAVVYIQIPNNDEGHLFEGREVTLGPRAGEFYVVISGVSEGELVVTNGAFKLDSELQIRAKPSMMSPDGGQPAPIHQHGQQADTEKTGVHKDHEAQDVSMKATEQSKEAVDALTPMYENYFRLQMGLADDDLQTAREAGKKLSESTASIDMNLFSGDGHLIWMGLSTSIIDRSGELFAADDIKSAREVFYHLSKIMIDLHKAFGHAEQSDYYLTYCPMANGNKGAYWLQTVDTVYNSFYGEMMLRCGEIKKPLTPLNMSAN